MKDTGRTFTLDKICVIVPTYNNAATLGEVIRGVLRYTDRIIVVNDGSTDNTTAVAGSFPSVEIIAFGKNRGKGFALRQGFDRAVALGYDYAVTIDSDGQHYPDDLPLFAAKVRDCPEAIIIGSRNMAQAAVPGKSSFGNRFSNFWFRIETGIRCNDTQSGFRLYPVRALHGMKWFTSRYEFEIEVLVRAAWAGIRIVEVPVGVFYAEKEKRVSHFRPFQDFARISVLNSVLVTIALLYIRPRDFLRNASSKNFWRLFRELVISPGEPASLKAVSVGFGVFMGIVPLWGFQMLTAIALSFLFRLNKALVIIAANISIPPMIPLILYLSHVTGGIWMGENAQHISFSKEITLEFIHQNFVQYVWGAITLAVAAGLFFGFVTYGVLKFRARE